MAFLGFGKKRRVKLKTPVLHRAMNWARKKLGMKTKLTKQHRANISKGHAVRRASLKAQSQAAHGRTGTHKVHTRKSNSTVLNIADDLREKKHFASQGEPSFQEYYGRKPTRTQFDFLSNRPKAKHVSVHKGKTGHYKLSKAHREAISKGLTGFYKTAEGKSVAKERGNKLKGRTGRKTTKHHNKRRRSHK